MRIDPIAAPLPDPIPREPDPPSRFDADDDGIDLDSDLEDNWAGFSWTDIRGRPVRGIYDPANPTPDSAQPDADADADPDPPPPF